jgi:CHAT domain-containing protein
VLIVADPEGNATHRLPFARAEAQAISRQWPVARSLVGPEAIRAVIVGELPNCEVAHFSCHALSDAGQPLNSGVLLASGKWLRVHDIMRLPLERSPLVVLSACETAGIGRSAPDEGVGLPAAFLQAGAKGVVASAWPVFDEGTALLMARLYDELERRPDDTPLALSRAQTWLREASRPVLRDAAREYGMREPEMPAPGPTPYAHPYFWAAFGYTG